MYLPSAFKEPEDFLNGWLLSKRGTRRLRLRRLRGFDITDVAPLPDGGILILERRLRYSEGIKMRIRRLYPDDLINRNALMEKCFSKPMMTITLIIWKALPHI